MTSHGIHLPSILRTLATYSKNGSGITLRPYQAEAGEAVIQSIREGLGLSFAIVFPRQSGKDELLIQLICYLMRSLSYKDRSIVMVNPTYKPQTVNAILRLDTRLTMNPLTFRRWHKFTEFNRGVGLCRTSFLSGDGHASVVGATASLLLIINEAQDIAPAVYDKNFAPMCASRNATRVFCGTVWTSQTLLAREMRRLRGEEQQDGIRRVFMYDADDVGQVHKPYKKYVLAEVKRLGRQNPMVKTQYYNEEIDAQASMFNAGRMALIWGGRGKPEAKAPASSCAFLIDVAGMDEASLQLEGLGNPGRDATALSIVEIDLSTLKSLQAPTYRVVERSCWTGESHLNIFGKLKALAESWHPQYLVIDATGVGEGLWALLDKTFPGRVLPVKFSQQVKSEMGWSFLSIIDSGRFRDTSGDLAREQYAACESEILPGPLKTMRWGVKDGRRGPDGMLIHDDLLMADALVTRLDALEWHVHTRTMVVEGDDPLKRKMKF